MESALKRKAWQSCHISFIAALLFRVHKPALERRFIIFIAPPPILRRKLVCRLAVGNSIGSKERSNYCLCKKLEENERHCHLLLASNIFGGMTPLFLIVVSALVLVVDLALQPLYSLSKAPFRYVGWKIMRGPEPVST